MFKGKKVLIVIFLLAVFIRLFFAMTNQELIYGDEGVYNNIALSLLHEHEFAEIKGQPTAYITPLYPIFLSIVYSIFGYSLLAAKLVQALIGSVTCLIIYLIAKEVVGRSAALLSFLFMATHHFFISYGRLLLSENLFIFLVALSVLYMVRFCKNPTHLNACFFGLFCSLATLTRSAYFLFLPLCIPFLLFVIRRMGLNKRSIAKLFVSICLCFILPISVWTVRNFRVFGKVIPLGTEAGIVLYAAYNPPEGKLLDMSVHNDITLEASKKPEVEYCAFLLKHAILAIKNEPSKLYKYIPLKLMYFFSVFDWIAFDGDGVYNFSTAFILPLSLMGIFLGFRRRFSYMYFAVLSPVIYFLLITVGIMGVPRTRLPVEPYLIIFAAFFVVEFYKKMRFKKGVVCGLSLWYGLNWSFYINSYRVKEIARGFFEALGLW